MDILDLRHLATAIEAGNFSRAARQLGLNPATVSRRIARLEDEIGVTLFERGPFGIRMTTVGEMIVVHVRRALEDFEAIARVGQNGGAGQIGSIRLGVRMPPIGDPLQSLLSAWRDEHRSVRLTVYELSDHQINAALSERRLDVAFITHHSVQPGSVTIPVYRERIYAAVPELHVLAAERRVTWDMLRSEIVLVDFRGELTRDFH
jgi:DNA-binding transcriptional LysR family regulator